MLHNIGKILTTQIKESLFENTELNRDESFSLLRGLISDITEILSQLLDGTLVGNNRVILILVIILFEETLLATISAGTNNISEFLGHLPEAAVVIKGFLNLLDLFSNVGCDVVHFTVFADVVHVWNIRLTAGHSRESVLLVDCSNAFLVSHVDVA